MQVASPAARAAVDDTDTARRLYESATRHFDLTEYEAALNDFKEGYRHKDDPVFLYNIAQCYRLMNKNDEALRFYRSYLRRAPSAPNRDEVERRITTLQESLAAAERARATPPQTTLPPSNIKPSADAPPTATTTPPTTTPPAVEPPPPSSSTATSTSVTATAPPRHTPVYKKWWLWTIVGVVAVGAGVGLGVGLSSSSTRSYPGVTF
jgi:hypothetical protein